MTTTDFHALEAKARRGELTDADITRAYSIIGDIHALGLRVRAEQRVRERRENAYRHAVQQYAAKMAPVFGLEKSLPVGDR